MTNSYNFCPKKSLRLTEDLKYESQVAGLRDCLSEIKRKEIQERHSITLFQELHKFYRKH